MDDERRYYQIPVHYTKRRPVQNLIFAGGAKYLGLYLAVWEDCINRHGCISREGLFLKAMNLGFTRKSLSNFLKVAMKESLIIQCNGRNILCLPDLQKVERRREQANEYLQKLLQELGGRSVC